VVPYLLYTVFRACNEKKAKQYDRMSVTEFKVSVRNLPQKFVHHNHFQVMHGAVSQSGGHNSKSPEYEFESRK